jgi:hypothetical protein
MDGWKKVSFSPAAAISSLDSEPRGGWMTKKLGLIE